LHNYFSKELMIGVMDDHKAQSIVDLTEYIASSRLFWLTLPPYVSVDQSAVPLESFKTKFLSAWNYK
jgi:hypothetical protein